MKDIVRRVILGVILGWVFCGMVLGVNIQFQPQNPNVGQEVTFQVNGNPTICANCVWAFGDGNNKPNVSSDQSVKHTFKDSGNFNVSLTFNGCPQGEVPPAPLNVNVSVSDNRTVTFSPNNPKVGDQVTFVLNNAGNTSVKWNFGEGQIKMGNSNDSYTYQNQGSFNVKAFDFGGTSQQPVTATVNVTDNRNLVVNPNQAKVGQEVNLTLQNAATQNGVKWDFGDNEIKNNGLAAEKHTYKKAGNFNIRAFDFNGQAQQPISANINITDTRQININPMTARVGQELTFTLQDAVTQTVKWIFGDNDVKTGQKTEKHTYKKSGNFTIKAFDFDGNGQPPITKTVNVTDTRKINLNPPQPKVGEKVKITLQDAATPGVKWEFGFGMGKMGQASEDYIFTKQGMVTIKAFDFNGTAQQPITQTVNVVDLRQVIQIPQNPAVGQIVKFSGQNFSSNNLSWKVNSEPEKFGPSFNYKCITSGPFNLTVSETIGSVTLKKDLTFNVNENRSVNWTPQNPRAGEEIKFRSSNFQFSRILWDFGDGFRNLNTPQTTHIYDRRGSYTLRVVDQSGRDTKAFTYRINIAPDPRIVEGPSEMVSAGEKISLHAKGFYDQNLEWDLGDGKKLTTREMVSHQFSQPGTYQVKVKDRSGKDKKTILYQIQVKNDQRKITASKSSARVEENITFKAVNFYSPQIKWDFGDKTGRVGGREISHKFGKNGEYTVKAIDYGGKDNRVFSTRVNIQIARSQVSELMISGGEIYFLDTNRNYTVVPEDYSKLTAKVRLKFEGTGNLRGHWYLNNKKFRMISKNLSFGQSTILELKAIPAMQPGLHLLSFKTDDPKSEHQLNAFYFVSVGKEKVYLLSPKEKGRLTGNTFLFKWKNPGGTAKVRLDFAVKITQLFKKPAFSIGVTKDQQKLITLPASMKGKVFWYITALDSKNKVIGNSHIGVFNIQ